MNLFLIWHQGLFVFCGLPLFSLVSEPRKDKREKRSRKKKQSLYLFDCAYFLNVRFFYMDSWNWVVHCMEMCRGLASN